MRLWHKDLISVLPDKQLLGQWRECCAIAKNIHDKGTPNHILVNRIMEYPIEHFHYYGFTVYIEMCNRGFKCDFYNFEKHLKDYFNIQRALYIGLGGEFIFNNWHNYRYLAQCYFNLQEKYDCGGISKNDFRKIHSVYAGSINQLCKELAKDCKDNETN